MLCVITTLTACAKTTLTDAIEREAVTTTDACASFPAISYSSRDTVPTQRGVIGHNAAVKEMCEGEQTVIDRRYLCAILAPVTYSRVDTLLTVRQIVAHNAAYGELCTAP